MVMQGGFAVDPTTDDAGDRAYSIIGSIPIKRAPPNPKSGANRQKGSSGAVFLVLMVGAWRALILPLLYRPSGY